MATLDRWAPFLQAPHTLRFPYLALRGRDHAPLILEGSGEVRVPSLTRFEYTLTGVPADLAYAMSALRRLRENPYDGLARFRLIGTDEDGLEWTLGYTAPDIEIGDDGTWTVRGDLEGVIPEMEREGVARESGTELAFVVPLDQPMAWALARFVVTPVAEGAPQRAYELDILGTKVRFAYAPSSGVLSVYAPHGDAFPPTYTENWLGEPLRILFGQLVYPRLVARNLGEGRTHVFIRRTPGFVRGAGWAALWAGDDLQLDKAGFWRLYADLLSFVATARDKRGEPNWEANKVTALYVEIIQAARGTRWVWALTFASAIEGLVRILAPRGTRHPKADDEAIKALIEHIDAWPGEGHKGVDRIKAIAKGAVQRSTELPAVQALRGLKDAGVIAEAQLKAWEEIRNAVMHGSLVSPYSSSDEDAKLMALAGLIHALTREIVRRATDAAESARNGEGVTSPE